jgi:hypothetical protein
MRRILAVLSVLFCSLASLGVIALQDRPGTLTIDGSRDDGISADASTSQSGCPFGFAFLCPGEIETRVRINGISRYCTGVSQWADQGYCYHRTQSSWSGAGQNPNENPPYCGRYEANSYHFFIANQKDWTQIDHLTKSVTINCDDPPPSDGDDPEELPEWTGDSPVIIPIGKSMAFKLTSADEGVVFDIDGDGVVDQIAWTAPDSDLAFLALDRNNNGVIENGRELFGNHTHPKAKNGFAALLKLVEELGDSGDARIDAADEAIWSKLLLWTDRNHNGLSEPSELQPVGEVLDGIALAYHGHHRRDGHGNFFRYRSWVWMKGTERKATRERSIYDVWFVRR